MNINIADNLKRLRKQRGITQEVLADFLGVTFQAVSRWECGGGYPDLSILPAIANLFNVSLDELVGMDEIRNEKRIAKLNNTFMLNNANGLDRENIALMREALRSFPNDYLFMCQLICSLEKCECSEEEHRKNQKEAIDLNERVLEYCTDAEIRNNIQANISDSYMKYGNKEKAIDHAKQLSTIYKSRENFLARLLEGEERVELCQQGIIALAEVFNLLINLMTDTDHYTAKEKIALLNKANTVMGTAFEKDDYPHSLPMTSGNYQKMAVLAISLGRNDDALVYLEKAAEYAIKCDTLPDDFTAESLLIDMKNFTKTDKLHSLRCFKFLESLEIPEEYDGLKGAEEFRNVMARLRV